MQYPPPPPKGHLMKLSQNKIDEYRQKMEELQFQWEDMTSIKSHKKREEKRIELLREFILTGTKCSSDGGEIGSTDGE